ncbi:hypothetical protein K438DRAFT_1790493 [Mycena galopus ATCC 62051]|nr:hypothetical protein K438DRAFT_1790493 [Mycena galopus ATCC 62051]
MCQPPNGPNLAASPGPECTLDNNFELIGEDLLRVAAVTSGLEQPKDTTNFHDFELPKGMKLNTAVKPQDSQVQVQSAPPALVLVPASNTRHPNLEDRLFALFKQAQDSIHDRSRRGQNHGICTRNDDAIGNSAIALDQGQEVFIIGAYDEDDVEITTTSRQKQSHHNYSPPTVNTSCALDSGPRTVDSRLPVDGRHHQRKGQLPGRHPELF